MTPARSLSLLSKTVEHEITKDTVFDRGTTSEVTDAGGCVTGTEVTADVVVVVEVTEAVGTEDVTSEETGCSGSELESSGKDDGALSAVTDEISCEELSGSGDTEETSAEDETVSPALLSAEGAFTSSAE